MKNLNEEVKEITRENLNLTSLIVKTRDGKKIMYFQDISERKLLPEVKEEILRGILYVLRRYGFDLYTSKEKLDIEATVEEIGSKEYHLRIQGFGLKGVDQNSWKGGLDLIKEKDRFRLMEYYPMIEKPDKDGEEVDSISQYDWDYGWQRKEDEDIRNMIFLQDKLFEKGGFKSVLEYIKNNLSEDENREFTIFEGESTKYDYPWKLPVKKSRGGNVISPRFKGNYIDGKKKLSVMNAVKTVFENDKKEFPEIPEFMKKSFTGLSGYKDDEVNFKTSSEILEWIWNHPGKRVSYSSLINDSLIKRETRYIPTGEYKSWYYAFMHNYWKERESSGCWYDGTFETEYPDFSISDFKSLIRRAGESIIIEINEEGKKTLIFKVGRYPDDSTGFVKMILPEETLEEELKNIPNLPWEIPQESEERYKKYPDDLWSNEEGFKHDWAESWNKFWFDLVGLEGFNKLKKQNLTIVE